MLKRLTKNRKFNRLYFLRVEKKDGGYIEISEKLTVEFTVSRNNLANQNELHIVIFNLNSETRNSIYKDAWDSMVKRKIEFYAGYAEMANGMIPRIFKGTILQAYSYRSGADFRTEIDAFDGTMSMETTQISVTVAKGTPMAVTLFKLAKSIVGVDNVTVGNKYTSLSARASAFFASPLEILNELSQGGFFIDNSNVYILDDTEVLLGDLNTIDASNGLLGTPKYFDFMVKVEMLFEPRIKPAQLITLEAETEDRFNGQYKITGFIHKGIISERVSGDCTTELTLMHLDTSKDVVFDLSTNEYQAVPFG